MLSDTSKLCERQIEFCLKFINEILRLVLLGSISPNIGIGALPVLVSYGSKRLKCFKCVKKSFFLIFANVQCIPYVLNIPVFFMCSMCFFFMFLDIRTYRFFRFPAAYQGNTNLGLGYQASARKSANYSFVKPPTKQSKAPVMYNF